MAFVIKKGIVKQYNITSGGEEKIVSYENAGALLPLEWLFDRSPVALYYYDTLTDCEIYRIAKDELVELIKQDSKLALALLDRSFSMYIASQMHILALEQSKARAKLLYVMQYLVLRFGKQVDGKRYLIDLRLTHQGIANLIGTTRETTSTEISKLAKEGVVEVQEATYIINTDKVLKLLGEQDFSELSL